MLKVIVTVAVASLFAKELDKEIEGVRVPILTAKLKSSWLYTKPFLAKVMVLPVMVLVEGVGDKP